MEGKITAALKFLDTNNSSGILTLTPDIIAYLEQKHPDAEAIADNTLLNGHIPIYVFDCINEENIIKAAMNTKGSAGPSGMDAERYRRMLVFTNFSAAGKETREEISLLTKNLLIKNYIPKLLEPLVALRRIPLDKNSGIRPIGVGEVLRRIIGKVFSRTTITDIRDPPLQTCAGHGAGS